MSEEEKGSFITIVDIKEQNQSISAKYSGVLEAQTLIFRMSEWARETIKAA